MNRGIREKGMRDDERKREDGEPHVRVSIKKPSQLISQPKGFGFVKAKSAKNNEKKNKLLMDYDNLNHHLAYNSFSNLHNQNSTINSDMHLSCNCSVPYSS